MILHPDNIDIAFRPIHGQFEDFAHWTIDPGSLTPKSVSRKHASKLLILDFYPGSQTGIIPARLDACGLPRFYVSQ